MNITDQIVKSINEGDIFVFAIIIIIYLVFNIKKIIDFFEERKKLRRLNIAEALECKYIDGVTKSHLEEELATEHFKISTGIGVHKSLREAIIQAHKDMNGEVRFVHFKRALWHLKFQNSKLVVSISLFDKISFLLNCFSGIFFVLTGVIFLLLPLHDKGIKLIDFLVLFGMGGVFLIFSLFSFYQATSVISANIIKKKLS